MIRSKELLGLVLLITALCGSSRAIVHDKERPRDEPQVENSESSEPDLSKVKRSLGHEYALGPANYAPVPLGQLAPLPRPLLRAPLVFPAVQQKIVPGGAFVTSQTINYPRYPVFRAVRPVVAAFPAPPAPLPVPFPSAHPPILPNSQPFPLPPPAPAFPLPPPAPAFPVAPPPPLPAPAAFPIPAPSAFPVPFPAFPRPVYAILRPLLPPPQPTLVAAPSGVQPPVAAPVPCEEHLEPSRPQPEFIPVRPVTEAWKPVYLPPPPPPSHIVKRPTHPFVFKVKSRYRW